MKEQNGHYYWSMNEVCANRNREQDTEIVSKKQEKVYRERRKKKVINKTTESELEKEGNDAISTNMAAIH